MNGKDDTVIGLPPPRTPPKRRRKKADVIEARMITRLDIPAERILRKAQAANLETAIVVGVNQKGDFFFASSAADGGTTLWWLELAKKRLLDIGDGEL